MWSTRKTVKTKTVLEKNESYKLMIKISKILFGDQESFEGLKPEDLKLNNLVYFKYAPITSILR